MAPPQSGLALLPSSNSPDHNAKGTQSGAHASEDTCHPPTACKHVVSGSFSLPAQGCFSPVPHGTRSLSVTRESLALEGGPPSFTPDFSCRALLRNSTTTSDWLSRTGLSPSLAPLSRGLRLPALVASVGPTTPRRPKAPRFGLFPFRSPLLRESRLISLPPGTENVSVPRVRLSSRSEMTVLAHRRVSPFGHPRINACVPLPLAYRSLPRPSSPSCAQASPTCFRSLDHKLCNVSSRARAIYCHLQVKRLVQLQRRPSCSCVAPQRQPAPLPFLVLIRYPTITTAIHCQTARSNAAA